MIKFIKESDYSETDEFEEIKNIDYWVRGIKKLFIDDKEFNKKVSDYYYSNYNDKKEDKYFKKLEDAARYVHKAYLLLDEIDADIDSK